MSRDTLFFHQTLANRLIIEVRDLSRRYFGDYHKVVLEVSCRLPLEAALFAGEVDPTQALAAAQAVFGEEARSIVRLERMGVAGDTLEAVRGALWDSFTTTTLAYMQRPDYPVRMLRRLQAQRHQAGRHLRALC
ncbi:hypothetical protein SAMN05660860_00792 [Geoalkalibacter ferrihydriticus]|uniref:Uncharacterized protein n=2 Tax=Geoalkalibacter ferrihydriticus TaxID=392333 RepID=A0A0C2EDY0_9BACT|nr:hypothetical protein [Geoalkalibacter ferrihydriticus]KIH76803.1 hypothetical protein GFER_06720 [Geoalkalibacter ferrihydriticus DSM 17813]SDL50175.1 hypothetical protein SAMN05660860_00792 [Geoalkalibacter ferrihydriticus]